MIGAPSAEFGRKPTDRVTTTSFPPNADFDTLAAWERSRLYAAFVPGFASNPTSSFVVPTQTRPCAAVERDSHPKARVVSSHDGRPALVPKRMLQLRHLPPPPFPAPPSVLRWERG